MGEDGFNYNGDENMNVNENFHSFNRNIGSAARLEPTERGHGKERCRSLMILGKTFKSKKQLVIRSYPRARFINLYWVFSLCDFFFVRKRGHCLTVIEEQQPQSLKGTRPIKRTREYAHTCRAVGMCWLHPLLNYKYE